MKENKRGREGYKPHGMKYVRAHITIDLSTGEMKQKSDKPRDKCNAPLPLRALDTYARSRSPLLLLGRFRLFSNMKNTLPGGGVVFMAFSFMHSCSRSIRIRRSSSSSSVLPTVAFPGICSANDAWNINELQWQKASKKHPPYIYIYMYIYVCIYIYI